MSTKLLVIIAELRLKGGDPLVIGRSGKEMEFLQQQGIRVQFQVVSDRCGYSIIGNSYDIMVSELVYGGSLERPLVTFLPEPYHYDCRDYCSLTDAPDPDITLVYMGLGTLPSLAQKLMDHGLPCDTPAVAV